MNRSCAIPKPRWMRVAQAGPWRIIAWRWLGLNFVIGIGAGIGALAMVWEIAPWGVIAALAVVLAYGCTAGLLNETRVELGPNQLRIAYGPLPWWGCGATAMMRSEIVHVFCTVHASCETAHSFSFHAALRDGNTRALVEVETIEEVHFLQQVIEEYYNIPHHVPESGEV